MRILHIEDEPEFIARVQAAGDVREGVEVLTAEGSGLLEVKDSFDGSSAIEEQLIRKLQALVTRERVDLVLLDTDLSRGRGLCAGRVKGRVGTVV